MWDGEGWRESSEVSSQNYKMPRLEGHGGGIFKSLFFFFFFAGERTEIHAGYDF